MTVEEAQEDVKRRLKEAREYETRIRPKSPAFADALLRESDLAEASHAGLTMEALLLQIGRLHGLCYAAVTFLDGERVGVPYRRPLGFPKGAE